MAVLRGFDGKLLMVDGVGKDCNLRSRADRGPGIPFSHCGEGVPVVHSGGRDGHAELVVLDFSGDGDDHD